MQMEAFGKYPATYKGNFMMVDSNKILLRGNAGIKTVTVVVRADQAVYQTDTGRSRQPGTSP